MRSFTSAAIRAGVRQVAHPRASVTAASRSSRALSTQARPSVQRSVASVVSQQRCGFASTTNPDPPLGEKNATNTKASRIGLIGARGYTGQQLIDLLNNHPLMDLRHVSSRELEGKKLPGYTKRQVIYENLSPEDVAQLDKDGQVDCWVMALPNGVCKPYIEALDAICSKNLVVDLSADYRFDNTWTYGLPELSKRAKICESTRISNPGCYATGAQIAIAPLVGDLLAGQATVFGVSGYSGAGTKPSPKNDVNNLKDNLLPYSLTGHIHEQEISHHLGSPIAFVPHVASWFRGISLTVSIPISREMSSRDLRQVYQDFYAGEELVKIVGEAPVVKNIANQHTCTLGGFAMDREGKRVVVCATIDNLNKGAATQCLQNMNLALGYGEYQGLPLDS